MSSKKCTSPNRTYRAEAGYPFHHQLEAGSCRFCARSL
jgi:hypothetical protein